MRIVYRMRGLLGDATEDMVNSLDTGGDEDVDNEEVYKMAAVMSSCGGLAVMLQRYKSYPYMKTTFNYRESGFKQQLFCHYTCSTV